MTDNWGRKINYLRLAITDRCDLRCTYCMPAEGNPLLPRDKLLSFEEYERLLLIILPFGIRKIRITGGEPFVRLGILPFLERIKSFSGVQSLYITTNGVRTSRYLNKLAEIGLDGINLSLDTLKKDRFIQMTRRDRFDAVWETFQKTLEVGISLKVNTVIQSGFNTDEIVPLAKLAKKYPVEIRFIEEMPFNGKGVLSEKPFTQTEILKTLQLSFPELCEVSEENSTARLFKIRGFLGKIGIIAAYTRSFCSACSRLRVTATGMLKTCLYDNGVLDLREMLRNGLSDSAIQDAILEKIQNRNKDGFVTESKNKSVFQSMATIGG